MRLADATLEALTCSCFHAVFWIKRIFDYWMMEGIKGPACFYRNAGPMGRTALETLSVSDVQPCLRLSETDSPTFTSMASRDCPAVQEPFSLALFFTCYTTHTEIHATNMGNL